MGSDGFSADRPLTVRGGTPAAEAAFASGMPVTGLTSPGPPLRISALCASPSLQMGRATPLANGDIEPNFRRLARLFCPVLCVDNDHDLQLQIRLAWIRLTRGDIRSSQ